MNRKQRLIRRALRTGEPIEQVAALPWRRVPEAGYQVLLVTSRRRGRFVLPKGWPMRRRSRPESAAIEALQEAGVSGAIGWYPLGWFLTEKLLPCGSVPALVVVYPLEVTNILRDWREAAQRRRLWVPARDAAARVDQPELAGFLYRLCSAEGARQGRAAVPFASSPGPRENPWPAPLEGLQPEAPEEDTGFDTWTRNRASGRSNEGGARESASGKRT